MQIIYHYHRLAVMFSLELSLALMQIASYRDTRMMKVYGNMERERKVTAGNAGRYGIGCHAGHESVPDDPWLIRADSA